MRRKNWPGLLAGCGLVILIFAPGTAMQGASRGIEQCIHSVIPAMFPFLVLSMILTKSFSGSRISILRPVGRLVRIPDGTESLLLTGFLGGYPAGAVCICKARETGVLSGAEAGRMLGFCCNAGPAFLFGIGAGIFNEVWILFLLWGIHILSALAAGFLLPVAENGRTAETEEPESSGTDLVRSALSSMAIICGWVVLFRILLAFLDSWFLWKLAPEVQAVIWGSLELTNGFLLLAQIPLPGLRFLMSAGLLGAGGLCVAMQVSSINGKNPGMRTYLSGRWLQTVLSLLFAWIAQRLLFPESWQVPSLGIPLFLLPAAGLCLLWKFRAKNRSGNPAAAGV